MSTQPHPRPNTATLWILQAAFIIALTVYGGVGFAMYGGRALGAHGGPGTPAGDSGGPITTAPGGLGGFVGAALLTVGMLMVIFAFILPRFFRGLDLSRATSSEDFLGMCIRRVVITNAILETTALIGFAILIIGLPLLPAAILMLMAFLAMVVMIPWIRGWLTEYERRLVRESAQRG